MADEVTAPRPRSAPHAAGHRATVPERRTLTPEQAREAVRWAEKRGLSEEYGRLRFSLPLALKYWSADDARAVMLSLLAEPLGFVWERLKKLESANAELREELEAREYQGTWDSRAYKKGNSVTHQGNLWIAKADTDGRPGTTPDWQLAVRKGADGRVR